MEESVFRGERQNKMSEEVLIHYQNMTQANEKGVFLIVGRRGSIAQYGAFGTV